MKRTRKIKAVDLFCGAGGSSTGLRLACEAAGIKLELIAVNHWEIAIATHSKNHPDATDYCTDLNSVDPRKLVPGGKLDLLVASPECTHHSIARGGKPINDQSRASAWRIVEWASQIRIEHILIENVKEFRGWGPLGTNGRPLKRRKGAIYFQFLEALRALGYTVEDRILNAADFGDPTSRERLFIQAKLGRKPIVWPEPTHAPAPKLKANGNGHLFDMSHTRKPHRTAREIIDWSIPGESIFTRKRPLKPNTLNRIFRGLEKFAGIPFVVATEHLGANGCQVRSIESPLQTITTRGQFGLAQPYIVVLRNNADAQSLDLPLKTLAAGGQHFGIAQPFIVELRGGQDARSLDKPISTITTKGMHHALCEPFVMVNRNANVPKSIDEPLPPLCTADHMAVVQPFLVQMDHSKNNLPARAVDRPMPTITSADAMGLVQPFLVKFHGNHEGRNDGQNRNHSLDEPLPTLDCSNRFGLAQPFIIPTNHGQDERSHDINKPMPTITTVDAWGLIQPCLVKYNGTGGAMSVDDPIDTITAKDRFGLVEPTIQPGEHLAVLDIRFRMLQPHELAAAMGFPKTYVFMGNREQKVKQIGNAVAVNLAKALCAAILKGVA